MKLIARKKCCILLQKVKENERKKIKIKMCELQQQNVGKLKLITRMHSLIKLHELIKCDNSCTYAHFHVIDQYILNVLFKIQFFILLTVQIFLLCFKKEN